jgi:hypothetical protein
MPDESPDFEPLLRVLQENRVEFVIVGGLAAIFYGSDIPTLDLDIVHQREPDNIERLLSALKALRAHYWEHIGKHLEPEASALALPGHHLLATQYGRIDVLGRIGHNLDYQALIERASGFELEPGLTVRVIHIDDLILSKEQADRDKDKLVLPILRRIREMMRQKGEL